MNQSDGFQKSLIDDFLQCESPGRSGGRGLAAITSFEDGADVSGGQYASSRFDQQAHEVADHLFQKAVGLKAEDPFRRVLPPGAENGLEGAHGAFDLRAGVLERREIVGPGKLLRGLAHGLEIKPAHGPDKGCPLRQDEVRFQDSTLDARTRTLWSEIQKLQAEVKELLSLLHYIHKV